MKKKTKIGVDELYAHRKDLLQADFVFTANGKIIKYLYPVEVMIRKINGNSVFFVKRFFAEGKNTRR